MLGRFMLLKVVEIGKGTNKRCVVVFPGDMTRILEFDKSSIWKAILNAYPTFPVDVFLAVRDY